MHTAGADDGRPAARASTSCTARSATGLIAGPDRPPPPPPRTGRRVSASMTSPSTVFTSVSPVAPASTAAPRDLDEVGHVRRQLGEHRELEPARRTTAAHDASRCASGSCANISRRGARFGQLDVDLDRDEVGDRGPSSSAAAREVVDGVTPDRRDHARAERAQRREVVLDPRARRPDPAARPR